MIKQAFQNIKQFFCRHQWKADMHTFYKNKEKGIALDKGYKEAKALSQIKAPDFIMPIPKCERCGYVPHKILIALTEAYMEYCARSG